MAYFKEILLMIFLTRFSDCANILGLVGIASPSHHVWNHVLMKGLATKGHNVTVLSGDLETERVKNLQYIHLENMYKYIFNDEKTESEGIDRDILKYIDAEADIFKTNRINHLYYEIMCRGIAESEGFLRMLDSYADSAFDLILYDYTMGPCLLGFLHKFKYPPMVGISAFNIPPFTLDLVGGHVYPAYIPYYGLKYDTIMSFWQKLHNYATYLYQFLYKHFVFMEKIDSIMKPFFDEAMPSLGELEKRTLLVLANSHPTVHYPEPLPPNIIEVGGLQIGDPKPLQKDLEEFIDSAKTGVVLFSLGTNMRSEFLGKKRCNMIAKVISKFPQYNFLWKLESTQLIEEIPENVLIRSWLPQRDILAHKKTRAFVTHAGGLSTQEAIWFGVPMIGIPIYADQPRNHRRAVSLGISESVNVLTMTEDTLEKAIRNVLENSSYSENVKTRSKLYRDRPMKPLDTAIWWIEYAIRNPKTNHLRSPVLDVGIINGNGLDVMLFLGLVVMFFIYLNLIILRQLIRSVFSLKKWRKEKTL